MACNSPFSSVGSVCARARTSVIAYTLKKNSLSSDVFMNHPNRCCWPMLVLRRLFGVAVPNVCVCVRALVVFVSNANFVNWNIHINNNRAFCVRIDSLYFFFFLLCCSVVAVCKIAPVSKFMWKTNSHYKCSDIWANRRYIWFLSYTFICIERDTKCCCFVEHVMCCALVLRAWF